MENFSNFEQLYAANSSTENMAVDNMSPPLYPEKPDLRYKPYIGTRGEGYEPHVHVDASGNKHAKFWLDTVSVKDRGNMRSDELNEAMKYVEDNRAVFLRQYREAHPLPDRTSKKKGRR